MNKRIVSGLDSNRLYFLADTMRNNREDFASIMANVPVISNHRIVAVVFAVIVAAILHGGLLFWYLTRPVPLPLSAAAPLPMISMELTRTQAPNVNQSVAPSKPEKPKEVIKPKPDKPKVKAKPKPKLHPSETVMKQVDIQKYEPESIVPAAAPSQVQAQQHNAAPSQKNDVFIPVDSNAAYLNNPKPVYPSEARYRSWQGTVVLRIHVGADGLAKQVVMQRLSGHEILDDSALETVKDWKFVPAKRGEVAEESWVTVPIVFELE